MTDHHEDEPAGRRVLPVQLARRSRRRRLAAIGTGGVAVMLAGGAYFATRNDDSAESLPETTVMAPLDPTASLQHTPDPAVSTPTTSQNPTVSTPATSRTSATAEAGGSGDRAEPTGRTQALAAPQTRQEEDPEPPERDPAAVRREIEEARKKAAADGVRLQRPLKPQAAAAAGPVNERTERTADGSIRVISAEHDLSGQRELRLVDGGKPVGNGVSCTNRMRFAQGAPATARPTVLVCWRVSAKRSVVTMAVTPEGMPSTAASVELIDKEWAGLG